MIDTRILQAVLDHGQEARMQINTAWCAESRVEVAEALAAAEQELVSALKAIRQVRTPITQSERLAA